MGKRTILFLPYKASMWDSLESIWMAACADATCETFVIPIPYYDKDAHGNFTTFHYEGALFPEYVPIVDYKTFGLEHRHVDVIYIHNPYDDGNYVTSVEPEFYSGKLKMHTDKLVYVPYYATSGGMSAAQALCKAYIYADYIVVQAEGYKEYFDSRISQEKFLALGSPKFDRVIQLCSNPPEPPEMWKPKLAGKKVYFFNTSLGGMLEDTEAFLLKLQYVFQCFEGRTDACLIWRPHPLLEETFAAARPSYKEAYDKLRAEFQSKNFGIYDTTPDIDGTIAWSDAYIGDSGTSVTALFGMVGKPIFLLDNYIHRQPEAEDWKREIPISFDREGKDDWKVVRGNQLFHLEDGEYRFYCRLSVYTSGAYYQMAMQYKDMVYVFPANAQDVLYFSFANREKSREKVFMHRLSLMEVVSQAGAFAGTLISEPYAFLLPFQYPYLVRINMETQEIDYVDGCRDFFVVEQAGNIRIGGCTIWNGYLLLSASGKKELLAIDCETLFLQEVTVDARYYRGACALCPDGEDVWLLPSTGTNVVRLNPADGKTVTYNCRIPDFCCYKRPTGGVCMERAFGSLAVCGDCVILAPAWGNRFVKIEKETGEVSAFPTEIDLTVNADCSYCVSGGNGGFIRMLDEAHALFYHEPRRKLYAMCLLDGTVEELPIEWNKKDVEIHAPGFSRCSKWVRYGCEERAIYSLPQFLDAKGMGALFDREACLTAYREIAAHADGSSGQAIHEWVRNELE